MFDHRIIMPESILEESDGSNHYFKVNDKLYSFPRSEVVLVDLAVPSAEELSKFIMNKLMKDFQPPDNVDKIELGLDESWGQGAWVSRKL
jgi:hypothetical protein